jgi:hypothetical protein
MRSIPAIDVPPNFITIRAMGLPRTFHRLSRGQEKPGVSVFPAFEPAPS